MAEVAGVEVDQALGVEGIALPAGIECNDSITSLCELSSFSVS